MSILGLPDNMIFRSTPKELAWVPHIDAIWWRNMTNGLEPGCYVTELVRCSGVDCEFCMYKIYGHVQKPDVCPHCGSAMSADNERADPTRIHTCQCGSRIRICGAAITGITIIPDILVEKADDTI